MRLDTLLGQVLLLFGVGFLIANVRLGVQLVSWWSRRRTALKVWPAQKPPFYAMSLGMAVVLGLLILLKAYLALRGVTTLGQWFRAFVGHTFGELMMFVYFGYMLPLSTRITRGFYADGVWTDSGLVPYQQVSGISWKAGEPPTLVILLRTTTRARRLVVPSAELGEVGRLLRDKIATHDIHFTGKTLDLGLHDERDDV
jgi:hypothetical protein